MYVLIVVILKYEINIHVLDYWHLLKLIESSSFLGTATRPVYELSFIHP